MDVIGFRAPQDLWATYGSIVGVRGRSADLRSYIEWRIEHPRVTLAADPGTAGAGPNPNKFELDEELCTMYSELFGDDDGGKMSADLRAYVAWRVANFNQPLPGRSPVSVRNNRAPSV